MLTSPSQRGENQRARHEVVSTYCYCRSSSLRSYYASLHHGVHDFASHGVTRMTQLPIFKDLSLDRLAAIGADVDAAGGEKVVGAKLWKKLAPDTAARKLANALNPKQAHALSDDDVWQIKQFARDSVGRSRTVEFECGHLLADLHWITQEEQLERDERRLEQLLEHVAAELADMKARRRK